MKAVILAGGLGTRISEETQVRPKPMVEIGGKPILWHIMKIYSAHGIDEFIICLGFKGYVIKEYFANYFLHTSDVTFDIAENRMSVHRKHADPWVVTLVDTGDATATGGRLRRVRSYLGDGLSDVNVKRLVAFHQEQGTLATVTAVQPPGRFGALDVKRNRITAFREKPQGEGGWINGGFFVLSPRVLDYIAGDDAVWEREPLSRLAAEGQLAAYRHAGFWQPMDTLRDKNHLEELWASGNPPWKKW